MKDFLTDIIEAIRTGWDAFKNRRAWRKAGVFIDSLPF